MMFRVSLFALSLALAATGAQAFRAVNDQEVMRIDDTHFLVLHRVAVGPSDYWCAAGDYARRVLDLPAAQRIYISAPIARNAAYGDRKTVTFSTTPPEGADTGHRFSLSLKDVGDNMRSAAAIQYCYDLDPFERRRNP